MTQLSPNIPIEGRLLSPAGAPVPGVSVSLASLSHGTSSSRDGTSEHPATTRAKRRSPYWPEPAVTDSEGRFRLDGFSAKGQAEITIMHDDYVHESLTISTEAELSGWHKQWGIKPVASLHPCPRATRPIEGVVTDNDTGRPIAGAKRDGRVSCSRLAVSFPSHDRCQGHYRIIGVAWNRPRDLYTNVTPATDSGYLPMQESEMAGRLKEWGNFN